MPLYSYADLTVSSPLQLGHLLAEEDPDPGRSPDLMIRCLSEPPPEPPAAQWIHHWRNEAGERTASLAKEGHGFLLRFPALADFVISGDGCRIGAWPAHDLPDPTLSHLLLDQVLPRVLSHRGGVVLHASAVKIRGVAVGFLGETGRGKSTLAASLHGCGFPLLSDDGLLVRTEGDRSFCWATYAGSRLWPESVNALFRESEPGIRMAHYSGKTRLFASPESAPEPLELAALYVLAPPDPVPHRIEVQVSRLSQRNACIEVIRHSFQLDVSDRERALALFTGASAFAAHLPTFSLTYPRRFSILPAVHARILEEMEGNHWLKSGQ